MMIRNGGHSILLNMREEWEQQEPSINDVTQRSRVLTFVDGMSCQQCEPGHDIEVAGVVAVMAEELVTAQLPHELGAGVGWAAC